jgi:pimeloyl-ACP methyl ester carboxylesterase
MTAVSPPAEAGTAVTADGRSLGWAAWGPQDGTPVVLCPGAATSRVLGFATDALGDLGVRLVSLDRPGLGASASHPGRTLRDWPSDVGALGLDRPFVVGFSQGAPFALACACAGSARAVAVVSGTDELAHPAFAGMLAPPLRAMVDGARHDPAGAEEQFAAMTADRMWSMIAEMSGEEDRAVYADPAFAALYRRAIDEAFAQGAAGYARDTVLAMAPWDLDLGAIRVPVDLWYGARDTSPVHSPDHGATLERRIPTATRHLLHHAGGALPWTHGVEILRRLLSRA